MKSRKRRTKPGRESGQSKRRKYPQHINHKESAASRIRRYNHLVSDRVGYLQSNLATTVSVDNLREAKRRQTQAENELGAVYEIQERKRGRKTEYRLKLKKIDRTKVKQSSRMKEILSDLKDPSNSRNGRKAKALEELGRRETWYGFAVGDTNE